MREPARPRDPRDRRLLLTGRPGVGKTTALRRAARLLEGLPIAGFYTEEIRHPGGGRVGFRGVTFDGLERVIAHVDRPGPPRVGRYGVDVTAVDRLAAAALETGEQGAIHLIDEIGKMECFSQRFVASVRAILDLDAIVVATVALGGGGLIAEVKRRPGSVLCEVTPRNRDALPERIARRVRLLAGDAADQLF